jgi:hypothetical protein
MNNIPEHDDIDFTPEYDWNPNDPILKSALAPHETAGTLRIHRTNMPGPKIMELLKLKGTELMRSLQKAMTDEGQAARKGIPIHDARVPRGTK